MAQMVKPVSALNILLLSMGLAISLVGCDEDSTPPLTPTPLQHVPLNAKVYFSQSAGGTAENTPENQLLYYLNRANTTIRLYIPALTSSAVADALIAAKQRNVTTISVATNEESIQSEAFKKIIDAGIRITLTRGQPGYQYHRFAVIDDRWTWASSGDLTPEDNQHNDHSALLFDLPTLAQQFTQVYQRSYRHSTEFGGVHSPSPSKTGSFDYGTATLRVAPFNNLEAEISRAILGAQKSVSFMSVDFSSISVANALIRQVNQGKTVKGVFDKDNSTKKDSQYNALKLKGLDVRIDGNQHTMGHQVFIIDDQTILMGSYGQESSFDNHQHLLKISQDPAIAQSFQQEFERVWKLAK